MSERCARCWARNGKPCEVCNYPLPRKEWFHQPKTQQPSNEQPSWPEDTQPFDTTQQRFDVNSWARSKSEFYEQLRYRARSWFCNRGEFLAMYFQPIEDERSVTAMKNMLAQHSPNLRAIIIRHALRHSRFQFTWSCMAKQFDIPEPWPEPKMVLE